jgi:uncharacterized protein Yka (UPF0111/DUF47 family)
VLLALCVYTWQNHKVNSVLTEINLEACQNIELAVKELSNLKNMNVIKDACAKINKLENKSDNVYNKAVFWDFENETDAKNIIKYKEVYLF